LLIGPEELALIGEHPLSRINELDYSEASKVVAIVVTSFYLLLRTGFIDEGLVRAVEGGATQVVILGAGFDSRGYRFSDLLKNCRVLEVDAAPTQEYKRRRLRAASIEVPANVSYACVDFAREELGEALRRAGLRAEEKTFFIWEGVSMYLPEASVRATLGAVVGFAAGSSLVLDYTHRAWLDEQRQQPSPMALPMNWAEPWIFGVPEADGRSFFAEAGLEVGTAVASTDFELCKRHALRADGSVYGAPVFREMRAEAAARAAAAGQELQPIASAIWLAELIVPERTSF
jgi:methyltransferase (TIGR00027 family)